MYRVYDREQLWNNLCEATDEQATSKTVNTAAQYHLKICCGVKADGRGDVQRLLDATEEHGTLHVSGDRSDSR
jgi:hypothetical protein